MWHHMYPYAGGGNWGWILGSLSMLLFWGLVICAIILLMRALSDRKRCASRDDNALAILKERYARGEIDKTTYVQMRKDLEAPSMTDK